MYAARSTGSPLEVEANRVADRVLHCPGLADTVGHDITPAARRTADLEFIPSGSLAPRPGPGRLLDADTRTFMEAGFGCDFSDVRIHTSARANESANALNAQAYTYGRDIVFGAGGYAPGTNRGRRLLAHELTHVVQQRGLSAPLPVQRDEKITPAKASDAPKLTVSPSKKGSPCACLVIIHNDERDALDTGKLLHENCAYNLALVMPDSKGRRILLPGHGAKSLDPNEFFSSDIARECSANEKECRDFLKKNASAKDAATVERFVKIQYFFAISDCSDSFSLPVVALHNNDLVDTKEYLKKKDKAGVKDLKVNVDKTGEGRGKTEVERLKKRLREKFGGEVSRALTAKGKTNIFRWCASSDLSRCHIGDPDHPDNVIWVTNPADFERLSKTDVNVALQLEGPAAGESASDLSTLFVILRQLVEEKAAARLELILKGIADDVADIDRVLKDLDKLSEFGDLQATDRWKGLAAILSEILSILLAILRLLGLQIGTSVSVARLRYVNIETPGAPRVALTGVERVENFEFIAGVLRSLGLFCCGEEIGKAESKIKQGLETKE